MERMTFVTSIRSSMAALALGSFVCLGANLSAQQQQRIVPEAALLKLKEATLKELVQTAQDNEFIHVDLVFNTQPDFQALKHAALGQTRAEQNRSIRAGAMSLADVEQRQALDVISRFEDNGQARHVASLWLGNVVGVETTPEAIIELAQLEDVKYVHYDPPRNALLNVDDPGFTLACGVDNMRAEFAWNHLNTRGEGVVVAVIDTGTCYFHPDIVNQIWVNPGEDLDGDGVVMDTDDENGIDDDGNGYVDDLIGYSFDHNWPNDNDPNDFHSHGSHTAGSVGGDGTQGIRSGIAPGCDVMPVRNSADISFEIEVWEGMEYAAINNADIISMSLGWLQSWGPDRHMWRTLCNNAQDMGTMMVIAAGNESNCCLPASSCRTPGDVPEITSVAATNCSDSIASFSSFGPAEWDEAPPWNDFPYPPGIMKPDISAPGENIPSHSFCNGYVNFSGTSMATPQTAGMAALLKSLRPDLTPLELKEALESTADDLGDPGKDRNYGSGRTNIEALFAAYAPMSADNYDLSAATGGTITFNLNAGSDNANANYFVLAGFSGNDPGIAFPSVTMPLNWDILTTLSVTQANGPIFQNTSGSLDNDGNGTAALFTGTLDPGVVGACLSFAYITPIPSPSYSSNAVNIEIVP